MEKYKYTLGIDPSGAFSEGKGTTGWCILDNKTNTVIEIGSIEASKFITCYAYWQENVNLVKYAFRKYRDIAISIEDYILYRNRALSQVNSQLETVQLIGIIKYQAYLNNYPLYLRPAVMVKKRWSDEILVAKHIIIKQGKSYYLPNNRNVLCDHERDAIRHAVHFNTFENKEKK